MLKRSIFLYAILLITSTVDFASVINHDKLQLFANQYLKNHRIDEHLSAISITLQHGTENPITVYSGNTRYDNQTPITKNNLFHIGSITKSFTSAIILQLEEDDNLHFSINDPIDKFFPQYEKWHGITIKQLLNMTSGIPDYFVSQNFINDLISNPYRQRSSLELINYAYQMDSLFKPGKQFGYSNTNYILLGMIIEKVTGHSLAYEFKTRLFQPLQLHHTFYSSNKISPYLVRSYIYKKITNDFIPMGTDTTDFSMSFYGASGGIISTTPDILHWVKDLFTPGKVLHTQQLQKLKKLVSMQNGKNISSPTYRNPNGFGLGIIYSYFPDINQLAYGYEGITFSGRAVYLYVPANNTIISVTVNSSVDASNSMPDHLKELILNLYKQV